MMGYGDVMDKVNALKSTASLDDRARIRAVMNGGAVGVQAVLSYQGGVPNQGPGSGKGPHTDLGVDLPTANIMASGLARLAQKIGRAPTLKTDMIPTKDTQSARKRAEKRGRIVQGWDDLTRMELQYPQIGRWLPGYGFTFHTIKERRIGDELYPVAELRDPFDVYPGMWGPDQQPDHVAVIRHVSKSVMMRTYPEFAEIFEAREAKARPGGVPIIGQASGWEGNPHRPIELVEFYCPEGTHVLVPEIERQVGFIPNPLESGPAFVVTKRFSFDKLQSQYHHVFGLMAMMAKLNILGLIATEDSVFKETNIIGELVGNTYARGRYAVNLFEPGSRIEKPTGDQLQQVWQSVNILERQFRIGAGYPVADDGQSPNSFATGQGIRELASSANENVREYQTAIRHSIELIDSKRLEWEEKMHPSKKKRVFYFEGGKSFEETYTPRRDIGGDWRTKRIYGAMATFDENSKIIAGLQLLQARIIDRRTLQENLDGLENVSLINERIDQDMAKEVMIQGLGQRFGEQDPAAAMALVEILDKPSTATETLKKLFTPEEPQMSPEEQAMAAGMGAPGGGGAEMQGQPPPAIQTILAKMEAAGGGAMSVGQMR